MSYMFICCVICDYIIIYYNYMMEDRNKKEPIKKKSIIPEKSLFGIGKFLREHSSDVFIKQLLNSFAYFKDHLHDDAVTFKNHDCDVFRSLFENEIKMFLNFNDEEYKKKWSNSNDEIIKFVIDLFYKFIFYYISYRIHVLLFNIENAQLSIINEIADFENYTTYKQNINYSDIFDNFTIDIEGKPEEENQEEEKKQKKTNEPQIKYVRVDIINVSDFFTKKINMDYIFTTFEFINQYNKHIHRVKSEIDNIRKQNIDIKKLFNKSTTKTSKEYKKQIFEFIIKTYPNQNIKNVDNKIETILNSIFIHVYIPKFNELNKNQNINSAMNAISEYIKAQKYVYDFINGVLKIEDIIKTMTQKIKNIDWKIEEVKGDRLQNIKHKNVENLIKHVEYIKSHCLPHILTIDYNELQGMKTVIELTKYLTEVADIVDFFEFKTRGYKECDAQKKENAVLDSISYITIDATNLVVEDCIKSFKYIESIKKETEVIIKVKKENDLNKLTKELTEILKANNIDIGSSHTVVNTIDIIFKPILDYTVDKWYIEDWWMIIKPDDEFENLEVFINKAEEAYGNSYEVKYNSSYDDKDNIKNIYNKEVMKMFIYFGFKIESTTSVATLRDTMYGKFKDKFDISFINHPKFKFFYSKRKENWLSYLWWFFNIGIYEEIEKKKKVPEPIPIDENNPALKECNDRVQQLQSELDNLKDVRERQTALIAEIEGLKKQIEELSNKKQECDEKIHILSKSSPKMQTPIAIMDENENKPVGQSGEKSNKSKISSKSNSKLSSVLNTSNQELLEEFNTLQNQKTELHDYIQRLLQYIKQLEEELESYYSKYGNVNEIDEKMEELMNELIKTQNELDQQRLDCQTEIEKNQKEFEDELKKQQLDCENKTDVLEDTIEDTIFRLNFHKNKDQKKNELLVENLEKEIQKLIKKQEELEKIKSKSKSELKEIKSEIEKVKSESKEKIENIKSKTEEEIEKLKSKSDSKSENLINDKIKQQEELEKRLNELLSINKVLTDQTNVTDKEIKDLKNKIQSLENKIQSMKTAHENAMKQKTKEIEDLKLRLVNLKKRDKELIKSITQNIKKNNSENSKLKKTIQRQSILISRISGSGSASASATSTNNTTLKNSKHAELIVLIVKRYILDTRDPNKPINNTDYQRIRPILMNMQIPPTPRQLIQLLNDNHYGNELNELLLVAINIRIEKNKFKYVKYISSQCNIEPSIQYDHGHTLLDIIIRHPYYDYNKKCIEWILKLPKFDVNSKYENRTNPFTTPLIQAILYNNKQYIELLVNHPKCDMYLMDSRNKTALDYVLENKNVRERNALFELFVKANNTNNKTHKYFFSNYQYIENLDQGLKDIFYKADKPLFTNLFETHYKNNPAKLEIFEKYKKTHGGMGKHDRTKRRHSGNVLQDYVRSLSASSPKAQTQKYRFRI